MPFALPNSADLRALLRRAFHPRTKLGKTTLWFGYLAAGVQLLRLILRSAAGTFVSGWATFLTYLFCCFLLLLGYRWLRRRLLWRLRNRLIVTYIFIGVIPLLLLLAMVVLAGYLFAGQFATYVASSQLQSELQHLDGTNRSMAKQFGALARQGRLNEQVAGEIASASSENFHHRTVSVWDGEHGFALSENGRAAAQPPIKDSSAVKDEFAGYVLDNNRLQLRAVKRLEEGGRHLVVISNMPITAELLRPATSQLGTVRIVPPEDENTNGKQGEGKPASSSDNNIVLERGKSRTTYNLSSSTHTVEAGSLPPAVNSLDFHIPFGTRFDYIEWNSGKSISSLVLVDTRPSLLYATLFRALGAQAGIVRDLLIVILVVFGVIELVALFIGFRLTRSITKSVAELYTATQYVNQGDLTRQISIRSNDQMAALESSFNSMTQSLSRLIAEQKEKQRMESELAIAHEVQALLFPADRSGLSGLEVHGVCKPARTVSGDYYDFIPLSDSRMVVAVGDISGKGISAALLMATVHAFVRAYSLQPAQMLALAESAAASNGGGVATLCGNGDSSPELAPGSLMCTLNYQLYRSTPPEKYATMFLASYDGDTRTLTYSNAGHLPPIVLKHDGEIQRLETCGTVVGLFDGMTYGECSIEMHPGDIFIAYSDGITEPENEFGEFGEERLIDLILKHRDQSLARISDVVTTAVSDWIAGGEQPDDVTLVLARAR
jgi:sigma-B regulation protein RsbU (phosphoserine phosphatase)